MVIEGFVARRAIKEGAALVFAMLFIIGMLLRGKVSWESTMQSLPVAALTVAELPVAVQVPHQPQVSSVQVAPPPALGVAQQDTETRLIIFFHIF